MTTRLQPHQTRALTAHKLSGLPEKDFKMPARIKARSSPEWQLQFALFKWWRSYCRTVGIAECLFFAVPNGASLSGGNASWQKAERERKGAMLKMTGLTAGVADCFLAVPRVVAGWYVNEDKSLLGYVGLFVELKSPSGIVSDDQRVFASAVVAQGYRHVVCRTLEEAVKQITEYLT